MSRFAERGFKRRISEAGAVAGIGPPPVPPPPVPPTQEGGRTRTSEGERSEATPPPFPREGVFTGPFPPATALAAWRNGGREVIPEADAGRSGLTPAPRSAPKWAPQLWGLGAHFQAARVGKHRVGGKGPRIALPVTGRRSLGFIMMADSQRELGNFGGDKIGSNFRKRARASNGELGAVNCVGYRNAGLELVFTVRTAMPRACPGGPVHPSYLRGARFPPEAQSYRCPKVTLQGGTLRACLQ